MTKQIKNDIIYIGSKERKQQKGVDKMIILSILYEITIFLIISISIVLLINYLFMKDFRNLANKIKRVISSPQKHKITQIKKIIYNYLF